MQTRKHLYVMRGQMTAYEKTSTVEHTGGINLDNRAVCKQGERGVYMTQTTMPIRGLVDELNEKLSNESECCSREEMFQGSQEKRSDKCLQFSTQPWLVSMVT